MVFVSPAHAQAHGAFSSAPVSRAGPAASGHRGARTRFVRAHQSRRFADGSGYVPYFSDYDSEPGMGDAPPQEIIERTDQPMPAAPEPRPGLVLELQGNRWVRLTTYAELQNSEQPTPAELERASNQPSSAPSASPRPTQAANAPSELPTAVLVFHDGHKEEIGKYVIVGRIIYANSDYWSNGSWTRKVPIADLKVPATLKLNQERGAKFTLPSGPNEVMMRP